MKLSVGDMKTMFKEMWKVVEIYLTIIPRARMGSESIAHEGERNNCFSKIQLVGQKYRELKTFSLLKLDFNPFLPPKSSRFSLLVGYNI